MKKRMNAYVNLDSKTHHFAAVLKPLGHPLRLKILYALNGRACSVKELWVLLGYEQPVISQQLAILKKHGVVSGQRKGTLMYYRIATPMAQQIISAVISN
jgi:ArsR family transcriptional regulator